MKTCPNPAHRASTGSKAALEKRVLRLAGGPVPKTADCH
jgi:hypothetical protein